MTKSTLFDQLIDQYKLQEHVAQQSVTDLYLAHDVDENRTVALEIMLPHYARNPEFVERFERKMRKVGQLNHPNIAKVLQVGIAPTNRPYITREYIEDYSLAERLAQLKQQKSPVNSIYALKLVRQIAETLALAERLEIFHYALRPENIMLKLDGTIVMVDLGVPTLPDRFSANHRRNQAEKFDYFPPEQIEENKINSQSHVYSIGAILYELLVGQPPPAPTSLWSSLTRQVTGEKTALEKARPDLSPVTYGLVDKCLRRQTWSRYQKIEDLIDAIDDAIRVEKIQISGNGAVAAERSSLRARAQWLLVPTVALVACAALGLFAIRLRDGQGTAPAPTGLANNVGGGLPSPAGQSVEATTTPTATVTPEVTAMPEAVEIQTLAPEPDSQFEPGATIVFRWTWSPDLETDQQFAVFVSSDLDDEQHRVGTISEPADGGVYWLDAATVDFDGATGDYRWYVALQNTETDEVIAESIWQNFRLAELVTAPAETITPSATPLPTVTLTPTPRPEVRVIVSSGSLRTGPGTHYNILRFLWDGDVVLVIGKDPRDEWYNVRLPDGMTGWLAVSVSEPINETAAMAMTAVPTAATIPASPTPTNTPTPTPTNTPTITPTATSTLPPPSNGGGGEEPPPTEAPPTEAPPPTLTPDPG